MVDNNNWYRAHRQSIGSVFLSSDLAFVCEEKFAADQCGLPILSVETDTNVYMYAVYTKIGVASHWVIPKYVDLSNSY
jgi:hypothetical protein